MGKFFAFHLAEHWLSQADPFSSFSPCRLLACGWRDLCSNVGQRMEMNVTFLVCLQVVQTLSITVQGKTPIIMIKGNTE